ncbi:uncharacterized protein N7511_003035 [Penicillium nucicola]|uniref:uncharacterized protein n=1 Tax=Penicillium nucicola TaxID=1850975 RepID=UPI002545343E|nr:uncharacterized protein N7511_003035 [Penicillium nucicola]KAJ5770984.1 hypothetical protein N7511_003035 [Penicillium nucicola]
MRDIGQGDGDSHDEQCDPQSPLRMIITDRDRQSQRAATSGQRTREAELSHMVTNNRSTGDEIIEMETIAVPKKALTHEVPLLRGALVIEWNVPLSLLQTFVSQKRHDDAEFRSAKYSAITASPTFARQENFTLRQMLYPKPRQTEIVLILHISTHQDNEYLGQTLGTLFRCIDYMCSRHCEEFGKHGWKKFLICIVVDGRQNLSSSSRRLLSLLGLFRWEFMVGSVQEKAVEAHMFEYTTQVDLNHNGIPRTPGTPRKTPVQMLLCLKEKSEGRIEAHSWLSEAVLPTLQPHMLVFIPPGLMPQRDAVYRMWKKIDRKKSCGGAVGQVVPQVLSTIDWLRYPFFAASALEQKLIHTFDKPVASGLGSIQVFPTTFSAFRYLKPEKKPDRTGSSTFCDENVPTETEHTRAFTSLSDFPEYRPWLMEPFSQHQLRWSFAYSRRSKARLPIRSTDESSPLHVPISISGYIRSQRRQIQDKAVFILQCLTHARQLVTVKHRYFRKLGTVVLLLYFLVDLFISWFAIANLFIIFIKVNSSFLHTWLPNESGRILEKFVRIVYILTLIISVILGLSDDIWRSKANFRTRYDMRVVLAVWACLAAYFVSITAVILSETTKLAISNLNAQKEATYIWWSPELRFVVAICPIFITPIIWIIQHILLAPARINCLNISAFFSVSNTLNEAPLVDSFDPTFFQDIRDTTASEPGRVAVNIPQDDYDLDAQYEAQSARLAGDLNAQNEAKIAEFSRRSPKATPVVPKFIQDIRDTTLRVSVRIPQDDGDLNATYEAQIAKFALRPPPKVGLLAPPCMPLYSRGLVLTWAMSNLLLCALLWYLVLPNKEEQISHVENINSGRFIVYFTIVNWAIGGFWVVKFVGVLWYQLSKMFLLCV